MWPKKLIWQLYFSYLLIMGIPVLVVTWYSSQSFRAFYLERSVEDLKTRAILIGSQIEEHIALKSSGGIDSLCKVISRSVNTRFTVIAPTGTVIGDSERNPDSMENHGTRPEVIAALAGKTGVTDRFSRTLMENMMYVAIPVYDAGALCAVVRTALPAHAVRAALNRLYRTITLAVLFMALFAALTSYLVSRKVSRPIAEMRLGAQRFASGDFGFKLPVTGYRETDQLATALNEMARRLTMLENVRKEFVANVSHELRTPLTSIKGFIETLASGAIDNRDEAKRFIGIIAAQVDRLNTIVEDLLTLSSIERDVERSEVELACGSVETVLASAVEACRPEASKKGIALALSCEKTVVANMEKTLLEHAVVNLLDNAIKYSDRDKSIMVTGAVEAERGEVTISVADQGIGIPSEHLDRIFERFYRVDKARSRKLGGTGLGLSIVKHIVAAHNGNVTVESVVGKGSTFTIHLPPAVVS
jgi:signal transduction histidine kinase